MDYRLSAASAPLRTRYCVCRISRIIQRIHADNDQIRERSNLMKKAKRIIAAVLVLAMAFVFMALSVSAATSEPIVTPLAACSRCGSTGYTVTSNFDATSTYSVSSCKYASYSHTHKDGSYYTTSVCKSCGLTNTVRNWTGTWCTVNQSKVS